jgi:PKD repeat protein
MDGVTWSRADIPADVKQLNAGVFFNSRLVTVGEAGQIWQTAPVGVESNRDPVIQSVSAQSGKKSRAPVSFGVNATDADGDALTYFWDAGQGTAANTAQGFTHTWTAGGSYAVSVTVQDGKGGSATRTEWITVTDSLQQGVLRGGSLLGNVNGLASSGSVAVAVGETLSASSYDLAANMTVVQTSLDGGTWIARAVEGRSGYINLTSVTWTGSQFVAVAVGYLPPFGHLGAEGVCRERARGEGGRPSRRRGARCRLR